MNAKVEISKRLVFINSASSVVARVLNISVLVWLQQYLLRRISVEEYSLYPVLMAIMVFAPLLTIVLTSGLGRYVVEAYAKQDERRITQIVSTMFPLLLGAGAALLAVGWVFSWYVDRILTIAPEWAMHARIMMGLMVFSAAVRLPLAPFGVGLYVRQKFVLSNLIAVCTEFLRVGLLLLLLVGVSTRVLWVVVASVSSEVSGLLVLVVISRRFVPALRFCRTETRWSAAREMTSFGIWNSVLHLAYTLGRGVDPIILNKLGTALDVTCLYLGSLAYFQIQQFSHLVRVPLQPPLTAMHAMGAKERLRNTYVRGGRYALWATLLISLPLIVYRGELVALYVGEGYLTAATVMGLLLLLFPIAYGSVMTPMVAHATAQVRPLAIRRILMQVVRLLVAVYLVGVVGMGAVGVALSTLVVVGISQPLLLWPLGLRLAGVQLHLWIRETVRPGLVPGLAATAVWMGLKLLVGPESWLSLGGCAACGCLFYVAILMAFCLRPCDREDLARITAKIKSRVPIGRVA